MAYITIPEARRAFTAQTKAFSARVTESRTALMTTDFDIFLSQAKVDETIIGGLTALLERAGFSVYVDYVVDGDLDRSRVTAANADHLRRRMRRCRALLFASSVTSPSSKWMPWELGYFDGRKGSRKVAVVPLVASAGNSFIGQEYLGLYPKVERRNAELVVATRGTTAKVTALRQFVRG